MDEHALFLVDDVCSFNLDTLGKKRVVTYRYSNPTKLSEIISSLREYDIKNHILYHSNPKEVLELLFSLYEKIEAAGGLVVNELGQILFIYRNSKWDLPKGKMEMNETKELTAIREVEEECGLKVSSLNRHLVTTYHTYSLGKKKILKANYWYMMSASSQQRLSPQQDENIEKAEWKNLEDVSELLKTSYDSIKDVVSTYINFRERNIE